MVIPLQLQGKRHQPFSMTQPIQKAGSISCGAVWAVWSNADVKAGVSSCRPLICARNTFFRLCHGMWLFHIHSTVDIQLFFSFPRTYSLFLQLSFWRNFWLRHFVSYSFGTSRKKASALSYSLAFFIAFLDVGCTDRKCHADM